MRTIHLLGSQGFIGRAIQREIDSHALHCWSHRYSDSEHYFNLLDSSTWGPLLKQKPTHVILLSWPGLPNYQEPFHITRNMPASVELVEQLILAGLQKLVIAGTCYEYGMNNGSLQENELTSPINCYAIAKDSFRRAISSRLKSEEVKWCWLRIFFPYGEGQNPKSLLPSLHRAIEQRDQVFPMSSGRQLRDFVPVEHIAQQLLLLATHPQAYGVYNGGSGQARSLREFVEARIHELDAQINIKFGVYPDREDEPLAFWADMKRMNALMQSQTL